MRNLIVASALALAAAAPSIASAEGVSVSAGATVASKYVTSSGSVLTKGPAFQPWMEAEFNGAYFGYWGSNVDPELDGADRNSWEHDIYVGYRNEVAGFAYDVAYTKFYMNKSGAADDEVAVTVKYEINDQFNLGAKVAWEPTANAQTNSRVFAGYNFDDKLSFKATYGKKSHGGHEYVSLAASYALNDDYSLTLTQLSRSDRKADQTVLALDYAFSFK